MKQRRLIAGVIGAALGLGLLPAVASTIRQSQHHISQDTATSQAIARYLRNQYAEKKDLANLTVAVGDRVVTLGGSVPSYRALLNAENMANQVQSVHGLINHVAVNAPAVPDSTLQKKIAQQLVYDRLGMGQPFNNLTVQVHDGVVTVGGQVLDYPSRDSAIAIASDTKGVKRVIDRIQVEPLSPFDDDLRFEAARAIYGNPVLYRYALNPAHTIRIIVRNGHVSLDGVVHSQVDKQVAQASLAGINGIFSVKNNLVVVR